MAEPSPHFLLKLFVAGDDPPSALALQNVRRVCERHLNGRYVLEVIDIRKDFRAALAHGVLMTPMFVVASPAPQVGVVGDLSDTRVLRKALRLSEDD